MKKVFDFSHLLDIFHIKIIQCNSLNIFLTNILENKLKKILKKDVIPQRFSYKNISNLSLISYRAKDNVLPFAYICCIKK